MILGELRPTSTSPVQKWAPRAAVLVGAARLDSAFGGVSALASSAAGKMLRTFTLAAELGQDG